MYKKIINEYIPKCEQEQMDKKAMMDFISKNGDALSRDNLIAHVTSSAFVVNKDFTKVLFIYHLIFKSWSWIGGHNDNDPDCLGVAIKETKEETGLKEVSVVLDEPIMLDNIYVGTHIKNGKYVPDHLHLNVTYLLMADEDEELFIKHDENSGVKWFLLDDILNVCSEERMKPIYTKAINIIKKFRK
ncbi:MAG: NUDIX hydrolase [Acholeplasma sp.]|nr:NUDIX hydrolase [Acholeplasma sp.]